MMRAMVYALSLTLASTPAFAEDLNCNNGIVGILLHLDGIKHAIVMEGVTYRVNLAGRNIAFNTTDPAGDKIDYVLDRAMTRLTETDHDRLPDGSFKTISLVYACTKSGE